MPHIDKKTLAFLSLAVSGTAWGCNWVVMKIAVQYAGPFTFAALRMLGGGALLVLALVLMRRPLRLELPFHVYAVVGFFQSAAFVGLATWAVVSAGAGKVAILAYTMPMWTALLAWPFLGERLGKTESLAIAISFAGIVCMVGRIGGGWFADVLAVLCGLSWAIGIIYMKRVVHQAVDLYRLSAWQTLIAGVMLAIVAFFVHERPIEWTPAFGWALAYNIVFANAIAYSLWFFASSVLPAGDASMGALLAPVVGVVAAWLFLGEQPPLLEGVGMLLVLAGVALIAYRRSFDRKLIETNGTSRAFRR